MDKPRDMDLTREAQDIRATISMARSLNKMGQPQQAKEKMASIPGALKNLAKQQDGFMTSTPNHPRLTSNEKSIKEAKEDYDRYCLGT